MERTVPSTASEEVELYLRTYYSLLRSTARVPIRALEEVHAGMDSLLHTAARSQEPDLSALIYSLLRLPACIHEVELVVLGQSLEVFERYGPYGIEDWELVSAPARRRRCYYNRKDTLACFIASRTDIDDVLPMLTAYQIEWNKLHTLLSEVGDRVKLEPGSPEDFQVLANALHMPVEGLRKLQTVWGGNFWQNLQRVAAAPRRLYVQLLSGSLSEYRRATNSWWENIERRIPELRDRPVYFISSNTHSLRNLLVGYALRRRQEMLAFLHQSGNELLLKEWHAIQSGDVPASEENFLYYVLKKYQSMDGNQDSLAEQERDEQASGIQRVYSEHSFDVEAQVFELRKLNCDWIDPRLKLSAGQRVGAFAEHLQNSDALVLNIDYPLGLSAYNLLAEVAEQVGKVLGVYIMGKAASLNAAIGDIVLPNVVHDEHSRNTYLFSNCFSAADLASDLVFGSVLDNQKAVTVQGTFLQNRTFMDVFYREGYTDIEMEAGPYLSSVYEMYRPKRHPADELVNLYGLPFDLGVVHYVSDTPLGKGINLGVTSLSYLGMDSTYAASLAVLRRIFAQERKRLEEVG